MSNSRRQFLSRASAALMAAATSCRKPTPDSAAPPPGAPPAFGTAPDVGPPVSPSTFAEAEKLVQFELSAADRQMAAGNWRKSHGAALRAPHRAAQVLSAVRVAPATRWDPVLPGQHGGPRPRSLHPHTRRARPPSRQRPGHRLRSAVPPLALDRNAQAHLRAPHPHLSRPPGALRSQAALRHHAHARSGAGAGPAGRPRDRRRPLSRPAARHPLGRQGPARHRRHPHHLRRRAVPQPRARAGCRGREAPRTTPAPCWSPS